MQHSPKPLHSFASAASIAVFKTLWGVTLAASLTACTTPPPSGQSGAAASHDASHDSGWQPITAAQILHAPVAKDVVELAYSPKHKAVFVAAPDWDDERQSRLLRLDPATLAIQAEVALTGKGFGVALDDTTNRLYLTQGFNGSIAVVDTARNQAIAQIPLMQKVHFATEMQRLGLSAKRQAFLLEQLKRFKVVEDYPFKVREMVLDAKNHRLFAPGLGLGWDSVLFVIDTRSLTLEKVIPGMGYNAVGIALDSARDRVFVSNMTGQITVVNARTLQIEKVMEVQADQLINIVYDPAQNRLLGVDQGIDRDVWRNHYLEREYKHRSKGHHFFALDADSGQVLASLAVGQVPIGLHFDAQRQRVYITNRGGVRVEEGKGSVSVLDARNWRVLQTIDLPPHPNSVTRDVQGNALYITVKNDGQAKKDKKHESVVRIGL